MFNRVVLVTVILTFMAGYLAGRLGVNQPVCHAVTEDSAITDCDYRDGGWYQR